MSTEDMVTIHFVDKETLEPLGTQDIDKETLGKIYLMASELSLPADEVLEWVIELGMEEAKRRSNGQ